MGLKTLEALFTGWSEAFLFQPVYMFDANDSFCGKNTHSCTQRAQQGDHCLNAGQRFKGTVQPKINKKILLPVVLFMSLDCCGVSCLVLEISAAEVSQMGLIVVLTARKQCFKNSSQKS